MEYVLRQGGRVDYNYKEFFVDTEADIASLPTDNTVCPGSVAYVIDNGQVYILNNEKKWIKQ